MPADKVFPHLGAVVVSRRLGVILRKMVAPTAIGIFSIQPHNQRERVGLPTNAYAIWKAVKAARKAFIHTHQRVQIAKPVKNAHLINHIQAMGKPTTTGAISNRSCYKEDCSVGKGLRHATRSSGKCDILTKKQWTWTGETRYNAITMVSAIRLLFYIFTILCIYSCVFFIMQI